MVELLTTAEADLVVLFRQTMRGGGSKPGEKVYDILGNIFDIELSLTFTCRIRD